MTPARLTSAVIPLLILLLSAGTASGKGKPDYSGRSYGGKTIEEYCADYMNVEPFDLSDDDLAECDRHYTEQLEGLGDIKLDDVDLGGGGIGDAEDAAPKEQRLSKQELEEIEAQKAAEEKKRLEDLGLVEFEEEAAGADEGEDEEEGEFADLDDDDDPLDDDEDISPLDDGGLDMDDGGGVGLVEMDDFGDDPADTDKKKKKKKKRKKGDSGSSGRFDDAGDF